MCGWRCECERGQAFSTSVGTKLLIALTGLALVGFLAFHLYGNLLLFFGAEKYNEHAHALISNPLVIPAELGLIALFLLHAIKAVLNFFDNRAARHAGLRSEEVGRRPEPQVVGVHDDDPLGASSCSCSCRCTWSRSSTARTTRPASRACATCTGC